MRFIQPLLVTFAGKIGHNDDMIQHNACNGRDYVFRTQQHTGYKLQHKHCTLEHEALNCET
jgi:hypothetical protein